VQVVAKKKPTTVKTSKNARFRYGIGEWYGLSFAFMTVSQRKEFAGLGKRLCPFLSAGGEDTLCWKKGGVCSLRLYEKEEATNKVRTVPYPDGMLRATCPSRFLQGNSVFRWIGEKLVDHPEPILVKEVPYLDQVETEGDGLFGSLKDSVLLDDESLDPAVSSDTGDAERPSKGVGSIDFVLVNPNDKSKWCALEMQAVYFSGAEMAKDFEVIRETDLEGIPFPGGYRRPDYRSSGPKRLLPQLQTKVPSLRRWGKKLAVLVDEGFWASLGKMQKVTDVSNCDIAWFVVKYEEKDGVTSLVTSVDRVFLTTLEHAIEGLTAGGPTTLKTFEDRIQAKVSEVLRAQAKSKEPQAVQAKLGV
jgi:hypothetical protein